MKRIILWVMIVSVNFLAVAKLSAAPIKGSFSGTVKDLISGKPIQGATIYIADIKVGSSTDASGNFAITNISEGAHLIEISHIGYSTIVENVIIAGETKKDFILSESIIENNAVIVTGVSRATQLKKVPFQVAVISKEDLLQSASSNVIEGITKKAGVSSVSTGPAISKPLIRGLGYNRVLTINDGVRQEGQQWGDEHGIEVDESSVNKIEVLKGPASLVYGSDAMAGVINIISNVPVQKNTLKFNLGSNYQTNNRLRSFYGNMGGNVHGINWNLYGSTKAAADFQNKYDGFVFNSKFNEHNFGGYAGYNGGWGYSHLLFSSFNLKAGLVEGERDADGFFVKNTAGGLQERAANADFKSTDPEIPYQHIRHVKIAADNNFKIGKNSLSLNVGWQQNRREEFGNPDNLDERALYFDLKTITYTTQFHFKETNGWKPSIGINGMKQDNINKGLEQLIPDYNLSDLGGFGFVEKDFKKLTISGGARYDSRHIDVHNLLDGGAVKGGAFTKTFSNFSGSAGLAYQATKQVNLKLNIARAFRAPSIPELASNGAHEGTIRYEYGESQLKSETSTQLDAAIDISSSHFSFNLAGYYNNFGNFIFYKKLQSGAGGDSTVTVDGKDLTAFKFDQRAAHLAGVEATLDIHPHPLDWLHIQNTFSLVSGKLKEAIEGSDNLPFIPAPKLLTELRGDFKGAGDYFKNFYVKFEVENNFRQSHPFTAYNTETATPGYTLLNMGIGADVVNRKGKTIFNVNLLGINLADIAYQNHLSRLKYAAVNVATGRTGVYNMGRNFSIKVNIPLSIALK